MEQRAMCSLSRIAKGGQSVDEFGAAGAGFEFADAIHHMTLEVFDDRRSRGVGSSSLESARRRCRSS